MLLCFAFRGSVPQRVSFRGPTAHANGATWFLLGFANRLVHIWFVFIRGVTKHDKCASLFLRVGAR